MDGNLLIGLALGLMVGALVTQSCPAVQKAVKKGKDMAKNAIDSVK